jgi:hypothetical protein
MTDLRGIERSVQGAFADFTAKRQLSDPGFLARVRRVGRRAATLASPFSLFPVGLGIEGRRYLFLSTRFAELISEFSAEECAIIGGPGDRAPASRLGLPFVFNGGIAAAVGALLFGQRWIPAAPVLRRWQGFFERQAPGCCLVVANDTLPMSLLLVKIAQQCANVTVVCVQHGLFNAQSDADDIDGRNSDVNLVYTAVQGREMERRLPGALVEVMGLPEHARCERGDAGPPRCAILVGPGLVDNIAAYRATLAAYRQVADVLLAAGFEVRYRPHPSEVKVHEGKDAFVLDRSAKARLLNGPRRVFIGLNSTLLCQAHAAGHVVISLHDPRLPMLRVEDFGDIVSGEALGGLVAAIDAQARRDQGNQGPVQTPRQRFEQALERALLRRLPAPVPFGAA